MKGEAERPARMHVHSTKQDAHKTPLLGGVGCLILQEPSLLPTGFYGVKKSDRSQPLYSRLLFQTFIIIFHTNPSLCHLSSFLCTQIRLWEKFRLGYQTTIVYINGTWMPGNAIWVPCSPVDPPHEERSPYTVEMSLMHTSIMHKSDNV